MCQGKTNLCEVCRVLGCSPPSRLVSAARRSLRWTACRQTGSEPPAHGNRPHMFLNTGGRGVSESNKSQVTKTRL